VGETYGLPDYTGNWLSRWMAAETEARRGGDPAQNSGSGFDFHNASDEDFALAGTRRSKSRTPERIEAVLRDVFGDDYDESMDLTDMDVVADVINEDTTSPADVWAALDRAITYAEDREPAPTFRAQEAAFMADKGLTRRRNPDHVRPSRTPEARRARHIRAKAERLAISVTEAERTTPRRSRRST
jgi:hypothetical protein